MTSEQKASYLEESHKCPFCKSEAISSEDTDFDGEQIWKTILCESCGKQWRDIYRLVDTEEIETPPNLDNPALDLVEHGFTPEQ